LIKRCTVCGKERNPTQYHKRKTVNGITEYHPACKKCRSVYARKYRYGIDPKQLSKIKKSQDHKCAICQEKLKRKFSVDHCHKFNFVRGLLCYNCNTALGKFKDDINVLNKAALYILKAENNYCSELLYSLKNGNEYQENNKR
jgi:hypothetical protein